MDADLLTPLQEGTPSAFHGASCSPCGGDGWPPLRQGGHSSWSHGGSSRLIDDQWFLASVAWYWFSELIVVTSAIVARYSKSGVAPAFRRRPRTVPDKSRSLSLSVRATAFVEPIGLPPWPFAGPRLFGVLMLVRLCRRQCTNAQLPMRRPRRRNPLLRNSGHHQNRSTENKQLPYAPVQR